MLQIFHFAKCLPVLVFLWGGDCKPGELEAEGRLFGQSYTKTLVETRIVTTIVPSSCVEVEPTLPPCRNVRFLKLPMFNNPNKEEITPNWRTEPHIQTTTLGWGEYFGLFAPTVTVTSTDLHVTTIEDPSVVVTYAVRGCRPLTLPLDLDRCPREPTTEITIEETVPTSTVPSQVIATATLVPTRTMSTLTTPTAAYAESSLGEILPNQLDNWNLLEPSAKQLNPNSQSQPTEPL